MWEQIGLPHNARQAGTGDTTQPATTIAKPRNRARSRRHLASKYRRQSLARRNAAKAAALQLARSNAEPPRVVEGEIVSASDNYVAPRPIGRRLVMPLLAAASLLIGIVSALVIGPVLTASATIVLTPEAHTVSTQMTIVATADGMSAVHAHFITATKTLSHAAPTSGTVTTRATAAKGTITFYNGLPSPQIIPAGTLLIATGGFPVLTLQTAYIPAAVLPKEGVTVPPISTQAENTGPAGNIPAGAISGPCCRAYVLAYNSTFTGGADARTYPTPTQQDIASTAAPLSDQVDRDVRSAIGVQLQAQEVLLAPPICNGTTTSSAQPGAEAKAITVAVTETCHDAAYSQNQLQQTVEEQLGSLANQRWGSAYRLWRSVNVEIANTMIGNDRLTFTVRGSASYIYSLSNKRLAQLLTEVAGRSREQAAALANHMVGVTAAIIQSSTNTLPKDPGRIRILVSLPAT